MFETIESDRPGLLQIAIRIVYLLLTVALDLSILYVAIFPGTTTDEMKGRGMTGMLLMMMSLIFVLPVVPYVVWKLVKRERPIFWGVALVIAAMPIAVFVGGIVLVSLGN